MRITGDMAESGPVRFAIERMRQRLSGTGWENAEVRLELNRKQPEQGYQRHREGGLFRILAPDCAGMMYGLLDLAEEMAHGAGKDRRIGDRTVVPYIGKRGIKFNIPLDARTPSYSDASDSAFENIPDVWDFSFWQDFLDTMAEYHYNVLSLWSLSPFPSMVRIPEYPLTALNDVMRSVIPPRPEMSGWNMYAEDMKKGLYTVKRITMDEKIAFWRSVMEYAADRCVEVYLFTWNLFLYGTEDSPYGLTCDQKNPVTKDYLYHAVKATLKTYPLLAGIGVTAGEHMEGEGTDIAFIRKTYGRAAEDVLRENPDRKLRFIHRMQYAGFEEIERQFSDFFGTFEISFKYSQAHMHSSVKPPFFEAFLKDHDTDRRFWFTLRDDDYYMFRWGDREFAEEYLKNLPVERMAGFYLGADGFTWGRDYMDRLDGTHPLYIRKMWYKMSLWGRLSYDIACGEDVFIEEAEAVYGVDGKRLCAVWEKASRIISTLHLVHWHDYDFQWYPEGCCFFEHPPVGKLEFADIYEFIRCESMPGSGCLSVMEYCALLAEGRTAEGISPADAAEKIEEYSDFVRKEVAILEKGCKMGYGLFRLLEDLKALVCLGAYYSGKLKAAVALCLWHMRPDLKRKKAEAVELLEGCADVWEAYSSLVSRFYKPQRLSRLCSYVDLEYFNRWARLDIELAENGERIGGEAYGLVEGRTMEVGPDESAGD